MDDCPAAPMHHFALFFEFSLFISNFGPAFPVTAASRLLMEQIQPFRKKLRHDRQHNPDIQILIIVNIPHPFAAG